MSKIRVSRARAFTTTVAGIALAFSISAPSNSAVVLTGEEGGGWTVQMMGLFSAWTGAQDWDVGNAQQSSFRVQTGFNPSKVEFVVVAPEHNGMTLSAYFQLAASLNGFKTRRVGEQIEVRAMDIALAGKFGTINFGRSFGIYAGNSIFADTGSMRGQGWICVGPDGSGPNCGHIGTGYSWTDWTSGLRYTTPVKNGFQFKIGLFDPIETAFGFPGGDALVVGTANLAGGFDGLFFNFTAIPGVGAIETSSPMVEAELTLNKPFGPNAANNILLWASARNQNVEDLGTTSDTDISGFGIGGRLKVGGFGLTANFETTEGQAEGFAAFGVVCGATGCDAVEGEQWYTNIDYTFDGKTTIGISYGEGEEDANAIVGNGNVERELVMGYIQHQLTPNFNINVEVQSFERETPGGLPGAGPFAPNEEYSAVMLGGEFRW